MIDTRLRASHQPSAFMVRALRTMTRDCRPETSVTECDLLCRVIPRDIGLPPRDFGYGMRSPVDLSLRPQTALPRRQLRNRVSVGSASKTTASQTALPRLRLRNRVSVVRPLACLEIVTPSLTVRNVISLAIFREHIVFATFDHEIWKMMLR